MESAAEQIRGQKRKLEDLDTTFHRNVQHFVSSHLHELRKLPVIQRLKLLCSTIVKDGQAYAHPLGEDTLDPVSVFDITALHEEKIICVYVDALRVKELQPLFRECFPEKRVFWDSPEETGDDVATINLVSLIKPATDYGLPFESSGLHTIPVQASKKPRTGS